MIGISLGTILAILDIADHDTIERIALKLETRESFKYDYSYSLDTLKNPICIGIPQRDLHWTLYSTKMYFSILNLIFW